MTIELTETQEAKLKKLVSDGHFDSIEQALDYALASVAVETEEETAWLKARVHEGLASLDAGRTSTMSTREIAAEGARQLDRQQGG